MDQLKSTLSFTGVAIGATATLPHHLTLNGKKLTPDSIRLEFPTFGLVAADDTNVTVRNVGSPGGACIALTEAWHPIERSFGVPPDDGSLALHLTPQPFAESPDPTVAPGTVTVTGSYTGDGNASQLILTGLTSPPKAIAILGGFGTGFAYAFANGNSSGPTGPCITLSGNNFNVLNSGTPSPNNPGQSYSWVVWA